MLVFTCAKIAEFAGYSDIYHALLKLCIFAWGTIKVTHIEFIIGA
jgi:hypothetical protein